MSREEAAKIHWAWYLIAWGMGFVMAALIFGGLLGWAAPDAMYVTAATLSVILALWSFVAVVFRKFFLGQVLTPMEKIPAREYPIAGTKPARLKPKAAHSG